MRFWWRPWFGAFAGVVVGAFARDSQRLRRGPQKVRVISDIHAGSCWAANQSLLFDFLQETAREGIDALILNGDVFDFWLVPLSKSVPSLEDMMSSGADPRKRDDMVTFRNLLSKAAKSVHLVQEGPGNHDMWLNAALAEQALGLPAVNWPEDSFTYKDWGIGFEHGHSHTLFNQEVPGTALMPIGYFVTRTVATYACIGQDRISWLTRSTINDILGTAVIDIAAVEILRVPMIWRSVLRRLLHSASGNALPADLSKVPVVGVVNASMMPLPGATDSTYTLEHFVEDYSYVLSNFVSTLGLSATARFILADMDSSSLDTSIAVESVNESMIVLGHTHRPRLELARRNSPEIANTPEVLVVNAGAWVADDYGSEQSSYLDIIVDDIVETYPECHTSVNGSDYRGRVHTTVHGNDCIAWGSHTLVGGKYYKAFGAVAFCRNLGDWDVPWCYTGGFTDAWATCDVGPPQKHCEEVYLRGAVRAELRQHKHETPLGLAFREHSTGSRWTAPIRTGASTTEVTAEILV